MREGATSMEERQSVKIFKYSNPPDAEICEDICRSVVVNAKCARIAHIYAAIGHKVGDVKLATAQGPESVFKNGKVGEEALPKTLLKTFLAVIQKKTMCDPSRQTEFPITALVKSLTNGKSATLTAISCADETRRLGGCKVVTSPAQNTTVSFVINFSSFAFGKTLHYKVVPAYTKDCSHNLHSLFHSL